MAARVLVTGASGLLGAHLVAMLSRHYDVVGVDRHSWWGDEPQELLLGDLEAPEFLRKTVAAVSPEILIHCAALANVDACEQDPARAHASHVLLTRRLVQAAPAGCLVIYVSSDGVFQGEAPFMTEEHAPSPRTVYGRSKLEGEREVALATSNHLIVRTNFYGWSSRRKQTAGEWLHHALETKQPVTLFTDFFFTPIYVVDFVERLARLLEHPYRGVIHLAGRDRLSKHAFGLLMAETGGFSAEAVRSGSLDEMALAAPRPKDISLSSARFVQLTGMDTPDGRSGLARFLADRHRPLSARFAASATHKPRVRLMPPAEPVTVLMAVHNGGRYLRTAVESILAQTFRACRFLIVDDASTDETREIIRAYADPRIEMLGLPCNVGQTAALNIGLRHASSPWIARMDADDYAAPERLAEQMQAVEADPALDCVGTFAWLFRDDPRVVEGAIDKPLQDAAIKRQMWRMVPLIHGSLLMRRRTVVEAGGYDERYRYSADWDLYHRWLPRCRAVNLPKRLVGIRRHPHQDSFSRNAVDENLEIFSRLLATSRRSSWDRAIRGSLSYTYMMRARLSLREGKTGDGVRDVTSAFRYSPSTAVKQLVRLGCSP